MFFLFAPGGVHGRSLSLTLDYFWSHEEPSMWLTNSKSGGKSFLVATFPRQSFFRWYSKVIIARVWRNSTLSFPRSRPPLLDPLSGREKLGMGQGGYGSSSGLLKTKRGKWYPLPQRRALQLPSPPTSWAENPLHRRPGGSWCSRSSRCCESTIMKSGCTVVNSTFYIYISYLSYIYKL